MDCHPTHVLDTSVCIDLYWGGLIGACLDLPFRFTIPDFIRDELTQPAGLVAGWDRIEVTPLTADQISRVYALKQDKRCGLFTVNDLAALVLAKDISATLLTNDGALRLLAAEHGVHCHGTLWLLDMLVASGRISPREAADALGEIVSHGAWLPRQECQKRLLKWRG